MNISADEQHVLFGWRDRSCAVGEQVPKLIALVAAVAARDRVQSLRACRPELPGPQVGVLNVGPVRVEFVHRLGHPEKG